MSSVENLAAEVGDRADSDGNGGHSGQRKRLQQIQDMFNKQTEEVKALQHSTQHSTRHFKATHSPTSVPSL